MTASSGAFRVDTLDEAYTSLFDRETAAPRWPLLVDRVNVSLARARRRNRQIAVFVLQHPRGFDQRPVTPAELVSALQGCLRSDDTVARLTDSMFAVVCNDIDQDPDAAGIARRVLHASGVIAELGVALGTPNETAEALVNRAIRRATSAVASL